MEAARGGCEERTTPVVFYAQGAVINERTLRPNLGSETPWTTTASGLSGSATNGFRWVVLLDRSILGAAVPIEVRRVTLWM